LSAGANDANHEVVCLPSTSPVPVFVATGILSSGNPANGTAPVPEIVVWVSALRMYESVPADTGTLPSATGLISRTSFPEGVTTALPICGRHRVPPLATVAYTRASCSGVTTVSPCPMAKFTASPARNCQ
jgi:hypothetical protein